MGQYVSNLPNPALLLHRAQAGIGSFCTAGAVRGEIAAFWSRRVANGIR